MSVLGPHALHELVGAIVVSVARDLAARKTEGSFAITAETKERLELPDSTDLVADAIDLYLPAVFGFFPGTQVVWFEEAAPPGEFVRYRWETRLYHPVLDFFERLRQFVNPVDVDKTSKQ